MKISSVERQLRVYNLHLDQIQRTREELYKKLVEKKNFDRTQLDRVARNIRLDLAKGRHVDIEA
jgi:endonuclease/exonuclease/phosphatase family metal-dependent hydrolase